MILCDTTTPSETSGSKTSLVWVSPSEIRPAPENELIYRPVKLKSPDIRELADDIRQHGLLEPIVITRDRFILSGHRRHAACRLAGVAHIECRMVDITRADPEFETLLCAYNRQRVKSFDEVVREQVISVNPEDAYQSLIEHRTAASEVDGEFLEIEGTKVRNRISSAKRPMLEAVQRIVHDQRQYWPLSDRSIHYDVLNAPPLRHASKPESLYRNDRPSYQDLTDLLTRARLTGEIPFAAIADPTRTVCCWDIDREVGGFINSQIDNFLKGYWRDLLQSQPNHIEIVGEKNTVEGSIRPVAMRYCIPYTLGRGYCSLDPRKKMLDRYRASGKSKLIILVLSDFDPEGYDIPNSFAKSMRDDFGVGVDRLLIKQVCLTYKQVMSRGLAQTFDMKTEGSRYKKFVTKYPDHPCGHELESIPVAERSEMLEEAIGSVLDIDAFNAEIDREAEDAAKLETLRKAVGPALAATLRTTKSEGGADA